MSPGGSPKRGRRVSDPFRFDRHLLEENLTATNDRIRGRTAAADDLRVAGADEAGRGCLAGPLVAAAVVFDYARAPFKGLERLTDSKLLSEEAREAIYPQILRHASRVACVAYSPGSIDRIGLHRCNIAGLAAALESLTGQYSLAVVDAFDLKRPELLARPINGADYKSAAVGAASIVAKVVRDRLMHSLALAYPEYGFEEHVGYATGHHREALRAHGPSAIHRLSFQGVASPQLELWEETPEAEEVLQDQGDVGAEGNEA